MSPGDEPGADPAAGDGNVQDLRSAILPVVTFPASLEVTGSGWAGRSSAKPESDNGEFLFWGKRTQVRDPQPTADSHLPSANGPAPRLRFIKNSLDINVYIKYIYITFVGPCRRPTAIGERPGWPRVGFSLRRAWPFFDIWILSRTVPGCPGEACSASLGTW